MDKKTKERIEKEVMKELQKDFDRATKDADKHLVGTPILWDFSKDAIKKTLTLIEKEFEKEKQEIRGLWMKDKIRIIEQQQKKVEEILKEWDKQKSFWEHRNENLLKKGIFTKQDVQRVNNILGHINKELKKKFEVKKK